MALVHCWECDHLRSDVSLACPSCGAPQKRPVDGPSGAAAIAAGMASRAAADGAAAAQHATRVRAKLTLAGVLKTAALWLFYAACVVAIALAVNRFVK